MPLDTLKTPEHITDVASPEDLRRAIDLVATLRMRIVRIGLFGNLRHRPDPMYKDSPQDSARYLSILEEEVAMTHAVCETLRRGVPLPKTCPKISEWVNGIVKEIPDACKLIFHLESLSDAVLQSAKAQTTGQRSALAQHMQSARNGFFEAVTCLCDALWSDINDRYAVNLNKANKAAAAVGGRLDRLERIGNHVRLVSINASIEAARAGDVGRGLMVIAKEFKSLAEEIQTLAKDARQDMTEVH